MANFFEQLAFVLVFTFLIFPGLPFIVWHRLGNKMSGKSFLVLWVVFACVGFALLSELPPMPIGESCLSRHRVGNQC
jgi:4-amino-4-deoxy-L-arabinose transferase-like glycosyltransferase